MSKAQREKIKAIKREYEQEGLKEVKGRDGIWRPTDIGESFKGEYLECVPDADNYHRNKYIFSDNDGFKDSTGRPVGLDGCIGLFGSITLDDRMAWIPIGAKVGIIYCGERVNPGFKRPTKLFTVMSDEEIEISPEPTLESDDKPVNLGVDDPMARELIKDCITLLKSDGNHNPKEADIAEYAEKLINESEEPDRGLLTNVQLILAEELKKKKTEEEEGK